MPSLPPRNAHNDYELHDVGIRKEGLPATDFKSHAERLVGVSRIRFLMYPQWVLRILAKGLRVAAAATFRRRGEGKPIGNFERFTKVLVSSEDRSLEHLNRELFLVAWSNLLTRNGFPDGVRAGF